MRLVGFSAQFFDPIFTATIVPIHVALSKEPRAVDPTALSNHSQQVIPLLNIGLAVILQGSDASLVSAFRCLERKYVRESIVLLNFFLDVLEGNLNGDALRSFLVVNILHGGCLAHVVHSALNDFGPSDLGRLFSH
jgi:hypothetical protein